MYCKDMPDGKVDPGLDQAIILMCFHETVLLSTCLNILTETYTTHVLSNRKSRIRTARNVIQLSQLTTEFLKRETSFFLSGFPFSLNLQNVSISITQILSRLKWCLQGLHAFTVFNFQCIIIKALWNTVT